MSFNGQKIPRKSSSRILQQNEFRLLLKSRSIDEFLELKTLLQEKDDVGHPYLTYDDALVLSHKQQHFLWNFRDDLITTASNEWTCDKGNLIDHGQGSRGEWPRCKLCNKANRYEFCIVNRENGNHLNVGSSCIRKFGIDTGGRSIPQMIKDAKLLRREHEVDLQIRDVRRLVSHWNDHLVSYPILIPDPYDGRFRALGNQFRTSFENYTNSKSNHGANELSSAVRKLKLILEESEQLKDQMAEYSKTHEDDQFVATRDVMKWLKRRGTNESQLTIKLLKKDGHISGPTAHRIQESGFMNSIVPNLNVQLHNVGLQVRSVDDDRPGYVLATTEKPVIELDISHKDLLMALAGPMFENQESIERSDVMKHCTIDNRKSMEIVRANFAKSLESFGFSAASLSDHFESIRDEFDEWVLVEQSSQKRIVVDKLTKILDQYVAGIMTEEEFVRSYLAPRVRRYSPDEFQELYSNRSFQL